MDRDFRSVMMVVAFGCIGIIFAAIEQILYVQGTIIDEFIAGSIAITDLMAITIIIWLLVGVILAAVRS